MSKLINIDVNSTTYRDMVAEVLPRGPIWDLSNPGVGGMAGGLGVEAVRFHRRLYDLMLEAYPSTADELLAEWEEVFGLPLCTEPDTDDGRRVALAGRVAAQGGQSRAYYIDLAWSVLEADGEFSRVDDPSGVWIEEEPYGSPFEAWGGSAWDLLGGSGARHYWTMHLPSAVGATKRAIIECLLCKYKPAHTVLLRRRPRHYYSTPGGASDFAEASTNVAARLIFPGGGIGTFTVLMWTKQTTSNGLNFWSCGTFGGDYIYSVAAGRAEQDVEAQDAGVGAGNVYAALPDTDALAFCALTCDGSTLRGYGDGVETANSPVSGAYGAQDTFVLFSSTADDPLLGIPPGETGSLRNIAIFDRALTAAEIAALYDAGESHDYQRPYGADWGGELPPVYWCTEPIDGAVVNVGSGGVCALTLNGDVASTAEEAAGYFDEITCETPGEPATQYPSVTACYVSPGGSGDYAEVSDFDILFDGSSVELVTISMWVNLTTLAERVTLFEASDDGTPTLFALTGTSSGIVTVMRDDDWASGESSIGPITNPLGDEGWHHVVVTSRHEGDIGHHGWLDGVDDLGSASDGSDFATVVSTLRFFQRWNGNNYHAGVMKIANVAVFGEILTDSEIEGLASAGVNHDVRNGFGAYPGKTPLVYYRDEDVAGTVANIGSAPVSGLAFAGSVTSEGI